MKGSAALVLSVLSALAYGGTSGELADTPGINVSGKIAYEGGQIINGHFNEKSNPYRLWINKAYLHTRLQSDLNEHLQVIAEPVMRVWFNNWPIDNRSGDKTSVPFQQYTSIQLFEAQGIYNVFGNNNPLLRFGAGIFPVKYSSDAKNLGEYLFRTGAYPPYIVNTFEYPFAMLSGVRAESRLFNILDQDLFLHTERMVQPLMDWSLSYLLNLNLSLIEAGAGVCLHHWFPVVKELTTPRGDNNSNFYYTETGDTAFFTFKGIKIMGRWAFDPKRLMPAVVSERFGKNDLRLYAEAAVLGIKNYRAFMPQVTGADTVWIPDTNKNYYADRLRRMPVMFGFNFPTGNLLEQLSLEIESFAWPLRNTFFKQGTYAETPQPATVSTLASAQYRRPDYEYDTWKWSINARKTVVNGVELVGQVARDHFRYDNFHSDKIREDEEGLTRSNEWAWFMRLQYHF